jgi:hypothetical protein
VQTTLDLHPVGKGQESIFAFARGELALAAL